jgi:hypothetical protein
MARPQANDYPAFYETYISLVPEPNLLQALQASVHEMRQDLSMIGLEKSDYAYAPGKWTVKQLLQHAIDTERIFGYRALCIARGEKQSLPGFDENAYAELADVSRRHIKDIKEEFLMIRHSSIHLFNGMDDLTLGRSGISNGKPISVLSIGYAIVGHWRHHAQILQTRYGTGD